MLKTIIIRSLMLAFFPVFTRTLSTWLLLSPAQNNMRQAVLVGRTLSSHFKSRKFKTKVLEYIILCRSYRSVLKDQFVSTVCAFLTVSSFRCRHSLRSHPFVHHHRHPRQCTRTHHMYFHHALPHRYSLRHCNHHCQRYRN
jgi:hypothetical protein